MISEKDSELIIFAIRCLPNLEYINLNDKFEKINEEKAGELIHVVEQLVTLYNAPNIRNRG